MKQIIVKLLVTGCLFGIISSGATAQSSLMTYSPSSSSLIGDASRIGNHLLDYFTFYMRYNDSSYFCSELDAALFSPAPGACKIPLNPSFVITEFNRFLISQGYIGSYQGVGMYGWTNSYNNMPFFSPNLLYVFNLPVVNCLDRIASIIDNPVIQTKAFAIGEKNRSSDGPQQTYIMEFYAGGIGDFTPYYYAPMPFDVITNEMETADDVTTLDHYVIFATRDSRMGHAPVNLRIADTSYALSSTDINNQWQFLLSSDDKVVSELRLQPLSQKHVALVYTKYVIPSNTYYLCVHNILLADFLSGNNTIVSHEIKIEEDCSDLLDVTYDPDVKTMVLLLNGNNKSELYHVNPFPSATTYATKLIHQGGHFYSLDTIEDYYSSMPDCYAAIGDNLIFCQDISSGAVISESCLIIENLLSVFKESPYIDIIIDPLEHHSENKQLIVISGPTESLDGDRRCMVPEIDSK